MSRIETIADGVTLYLGDCREILPTLTGFDAVVTDPPYGIALNTNNLRFSGGKGESQRRRGKLSGTAGGDPIAGDQEPFDPTFLTEIGSQQIIWGWHNFPNSLPRGACLIWIKRFDEAFGSFLSDAETAWFSKGHGVYCFRDLSNMADAKIRVHPTQKPLPLMKWCIEKTTGSILDPFMGGGSTGVAAVNLGRRFTGIEIEQKYFDAACRRIDEAVKQPDFFIEKPRPKQETLEL
ncbi:DNA-methyltransferase [Bradyrhizobium elkanii]|uniref:DNA-methyltransferase n=1 Tax=Bradyrhizobium elkanii TaxID=29448 RepID=UPI003F732A10